MQEFNIDVCRIGYGFRTITVTAEDLTEAEELAIAQAPNYEFTDKISEYCLEGDFDIKE